MANFYIIRLFTGLILGLSTRKSSDQKQLKSNYGKISRTRKGDNVRSMGEKRIADWSYINNIRYNYEPKLSKFVPDFFLPGYKMVIEYYGLRDVHDLKS